MARSKIEVPWDIEFPQECARCTAPATKTTRIKREKSSVTTWYFMFGIIGAAFAGATKEGALRYDIPYCENCHRQDLILRVILWAGVLLSLVFICSPLTFVFSEEISDTLATLGIITVAIGFATVLIVLPIVAIVRSAHQAVHVKRINERIKSAQLAFRDPTYFDHFRQHNMEQIISFALQHGKGLPVPLEDAIDFTSRRIADQDPHSTAGLTAYFQRGQLHLLNNAYHRAIDDLNHVVDVTGFENPHFLEAQFFRGQAHMELGNTTQAQTDLENYAQASDNRGRVRQAKQWLKQLGRL
jgi:hypothetical protein